jgi:hypothetical protein
MPRGTSPPQGRRAAQHGSPRRERRHPAEPAADPSRALVIPPRWCSPNIVVVVPIVSRQFPWRSRRTARSECSCTALGRNPSNAGFLLQLPCCCLADFVVARSHPGLRKTHPASPVSTPFVSRHPAPRLHDQLAN